jgi:hypothetical protein
LIQATKRRCIEKRIGGDKKDGPEKYTMDKRLKKGSRRFPVTMNNRSQDIGPAVLYAVTQFGLRIQRYYEM